jgi:glycerophosphoryl diester phosphodiesterase
MVIQKIRLIMEKRTDFKMKAKHKIRYLKTFFYVFFFVVQGFNALASPGVKSPQEDRANALVRILNSPSDDYMMVASHRGDWRNAPENSIQAIKNCISMEVDIVEIDVQMTKDSVLVLMHDKTLDRTTSGTGNIMEWTYDSLKTLNLRNGLRRVTRHKIPTLEEAMTVTKGRILVNLDKAADYMDLAYKVLVKTGTVDQVILKGGKNLAQVKEQYGSLLDKIMYMPVIAENHPRLEEFIGGFLNEQKPVAFEVIYRSDDSPMFPMIKNIKSEGSWVWVNTLWESLCGKHDDDRAVDNPDGSWGWVIERGANIIQTDRPQLLIDYLNSKGLHNLHQ